MLYETIGLLKMTPIWVWLILASLVLKGIEALSPRIVHIPMLFIIPTLLFVFRVRGLIKSELAIYYAMGIVAGVIIGYLLVKDRKDIIVNKNCMEVSLPGSPRLLILLLLFFCVKYWFGYLQATSPVMFHQYAWLESLLSGSIVGYLLGNAFSYLYRYLQ